MAKDSGIKKKRVVFAPVQYESNDANFKFEICDNVETMVSVPKSIQSSNIKTKCPKKIILASIFMAGICIIGCFLAYAYIYRERFNFGVKSTTNLNFSIPVDIAVHNTTNTIVPLPATDNINYRLNIFNESTNSLILTTPTNIVTQTPTGTEVSLLTTDNADYHWGNSEEVVDSLNLTNYVDTVTNIPTNTVISLPVADNSDYNWNISEDDNNPVSMNTTMKNNINNNTVIAEDYLIKCNITTVESSTQNHNLSNEIEMAKRLIYSSTKRAVENIFSSGKLNPASYNKILKLTQFIEYFGHISKEKLTAEFFKENSRKFFRGLDIQVLEAEKMYKINVEGKSFILFGILQNILLRDVLPKNGNGLILKNFQSPYISEIDLAFLRNHVSNKHQTNPLRWHLGEYLEISLANPDQLLTIAAIKKVLSHVLSGVVDAYKENHYHPLINEHTVKGTFNTISGDIQFKLLNIGWIKVDQYDSPTKRKMVRLSIKAIGELAEYLLRSINERSHCAYQSDQETTVASDDGKQAINDFILKCKGFDTNNNPIKGLGMLMNHFIVKNPEDETQVYLFRSKSSRRIEGLIN